MEAALEILAQTGDDTTVSNLLRLGKWTPVDSLPSGSSSWSTLVESLNPTTWLITPAWGAIEDIFSS